MMISQHELELINADQQEIVKIQETENKCFKKEVESVFLAHERFLAEKEQADLIIKQLKRRNKK